MTTNLVNTNRRRANIRTALLLALVALGIFIGFILATALGWR